MSDSTTAPVPAAPTPLRDLVNGYWNATGAVPGWKVRFGIAGVLGFLLFGVKGAIAAAVADVAFIEYPSDPLGTTPHPPYPEAVGRSAIDDAVATAKQIVGGG